MVCLVRKMCFNPLHKPFIALNKLSAIVTDDQGKKIKHMSTSDVNKDFKSTNSKPLFYNKETKLKGNISFNVSKTKFTNTNITHYFLEFWECVRKFMKTLSHKTEMQQSQLVIDLLKDKIENVQHDKKDKEIKLDKLSSKLLEFPLEKSVSLSHDNSSVNCLRLLTVESELQNEVKKLMDDIKTLNKKEQEFVQKLLIAVNDSSKKEYLYSKFIKNSILTCAFVTLCLSLAALYIYKLNQYRKLYDDEIKQLNDKLRHVAAIKPSKTPQSWGSYLKGYVRPLYSWVMPTKQK